MITPMLSVGCMANKILNTIKHDKYTVINLPSFLKGRLRRVHFCSKNTRHSRDCPIVLIVCNDRTASM